MASIENLILANHVEAINGLLYVHGGGFTDINRVVPEGQPALVHLGIGVTILVPWTETNRPYHLGIWVEPEDGGQQLFAVDSDIEAGRPAGIPEGSDIRAVIGLAGEVVFPAPGGYRLHAQLEGDMRTVSFRVNIQTTPAQ